MESRARYGLTAAAPKPMSSAMWWTSRASPVSITRPTLVRVFSRTRWWCTAAVKSNDGMGAHSAVALRSDRTMRLAPSAMASETRRRTSSMARRSASPPASVGSPAVPASPTSKSPSMAKALKPGVSPCSLTYISLARSSRSMTGRGSRIWRQAPWLAASRLASGPMVAESEVTSSSRMASSGGLVTWAKSWVK